MGIDSVAELGKSPFYGALFEGFVAAEIVKAQTDIGRRREIYYFRDEQGLEVDFLVPGKGGAVALIECKASRTGSPAMAMPMQCLAEAVKKKRLNGTAVDRFLVHQQPKMKNPTQAVASGVRALALEDFLEAFHPSKR